MWFTWIKAVQLWVQLGQKGNGYAEALIRKIRGIMVPEEANSPTFVHIEAEMFEAEKYYHP